jgi:predicted RNase H-like HicB family nuclease
MSNIIQFQIQKEETGYSAFAINFPIVTEAETLDDLKENIKEATELFFEDEQEAFKISKSASIFMNYEMPVYA